MSKYRINFIKTMRKLKKLYMSSVPPENIFDIEKEVNEVKPFH